MSRWAVRKLHPHACGPDGTAWVAGEVGKWQNTVCSFRTWAEAMAYADQRARTIEVVLSRLTALPTRRHIVQRSGLIIEYASSGFYPHLWAGHITVEPEERRPLALALLAIEQHKENTK